MNWGNKILVTFIVFGAGMLFLVYRAMQTNYELVEKDYYNNELRFQQVIDATNRTGQLGTEVSVSQTEEGIRILLPEEMRNKSIEGSLWFYCAYNGKKDRKIALRTDSGASQLIPLNDVESGNYILKISWTESGKSYYAEKPLTVL